MNSYQDLHDIIDLPRIIEDDIVPDGESHIVYITNPDKLMIEKSNGVFEFIPIIIPGFQWDYMWWIYRFMSHTEPDPRTSTFTFPRFLNDYLEEIYKKYLEENKKE